MEVKLLKSLGNTGVIVELEKILRETVDINCDVDGVLTLSTVGLGERSFKVKGGKARVYDWEIPQGPSKVKFVDVSGDCYTLGTLIKNNRFLSVQNPVDDLVVKLALGLEEERRRNDRNTERIRALEKEFGINVLEV